MKASNIAAYTADLAPYMLAGVGAGKLAEAVAIEIYAHQELAHRTAELHPTVARLSHSALLVAGMSPSSFGVEHRLHHNEYDAPSAEGRKSIEYVLRSGGARNDLQTIEKDALSFPGYGFNDDPLLRLDATDNLQYRHFGRIEQLVSRGLPANLVPLLCATAGMARALKASGVSRPVSKSVAFSAGFQLGIAAQSVLTSYAEGRAGKTNNQINVGALPRVLQKRVLRHQQHHEKPEVAFRGVPRRHIIAGKALRAMKLLKITASSSSI